MIFQRTTDLELVRTILIHPKIYPLIGDDFAPTRERFTPNADPRIWYVTAPGGLFTFLPDSEVCWQGHVAFLPESWGRIARAAGKAILPWLWENTPCRRVIASIPAFNRLAVRYSSRVMGMRIMGMNEKSFLKNGRMWDQVLLGISRP